MPRKIAGNSRNSALHVSHECANAWLNFPRCLANVLIPSATIAAGAPPA
jgi:hypothetical protein